MKRDENKENAVEICQGEIFVGQIDTLKFDKLKPVDQNDFISNIYNKIRSSLNTNNCMRNKKPFCLRPHAPLIPQFQLPNDALNQSQDRNSTIKRFIYKKTDFGKCKSYNNYLNNNFYFLV